MTISAGRGATYQMKRLRRDRPDLFGRVVAGEMSPNAAAIEAGFRRRMISVPDDPELAAQTLRRRSGRPSAVCSTATFY